MNLSMTSSSCFHWCKALMWRHAWAAQGVRRTSSLHAPIMLLTGHQGEVFSVSFSHDGANLASGSHDKSIFLWQTYGECRNYDVLAGHKNAVLEVHWTADNDRIISCSAD